MTARKNEAKETEGTLDPKSIEALRASNELFSLFMHHSPVYAYIKSVTPTESRILQASDNYQEMLGISRLDIVGKTMAELFPAEFATKITDDDWVTFANGKVLILDKYMNDRSYVTIKFPFVQGDKNILGGYIVDVTEHKEAEKALRASEENFRRCQDDSPLGMCVLTADGEILYANQAILDMYGYDSVEDLKATSLQENYTPESYAEHRLREEKRQRGENVPPNYEIDMIRKDGQVRHVEIFRKEMLWNGETQFQVFYNDITTRKKMEEKLQKEEEALRASGEKLRAGEKTLRASEEKLQKEDAALRADKEALRTSGEKLRADNEKLRASGEKLQKEAAALRASGEKLQKEEEALRASGEKLRADGEKLRTSEEKLQKEDAALRQSEEKLRILFKTVGAGIAVADMTGKIVDVNEAALKLSGFRDKKEVIGRNGLDLISEKDRDRAAKGLADIRAAGTGVTVEITLLRKNGSEYLCETSNTVMRDTSGNAAGIVCVLRDITEHKRMDEAIIASVEEKEHLLREVHHHTKNNMAAIIALMEMQWKTPEKPLWKPVMTAAALSAIENRIESIALVHECLYQSQNTSHVDLQNYLSALVSHLQTSLNAPADILCSVNTTGITLKLDTAVPVGIIVNELVTNALKYAFPDNKPQYGADQCKIMISLEQKGAEYTLIVDDNGVGLPKNASSAKTSALGLRLVKMLGVEQLGGKLTVNRTQGTRFVLKFSVKQ
ncbi:MAG: PAS domain S-box protein [Dehalococcoidia bacterium]|jgi:two-component sensor histidine kinase/cell division protein FtsB